MTSEALHTSFRRTIHASPLALVENSFVSPAQIPPSGFESKHQIVLPYLGLFAYHVGKRNWLVDATRTLCISPGWEFYDEHPVPDVGHGAILITPAPDLVSEICGARPAETNFHFLEASVPSTSVLQLLTHVLLRQPAFAKDPLELDEQVVFALSSLGCARERQERASKTIQRAKEVLHAHSDDRMTLDCVAKKVGVSPGYLTQEFTRSEGLPLYQYQLRLRLSRALLELPHCQNITELGLDLGFSSHSHFTAVFRKAFGLTPSQFRNGQLPKHLERLMQPKRVAAAYLERWAA
jgi:AraC family transcriptional regulator